MRSLKLLVFLLALIMSVQCYSQRFSVGFLNGVNRSSINGNQTSGKWSMKPGPITGIFFNYSPFRMWSLQTEISRITIYYEEKNYNYPIYWLDKSLNTDFVMPYYYGNNNWNFSFYRLPIQLRFNTPTRLKFQLSAGIYFSYRYDYGKIQNYSVDAPPRYDFGYIYSTGFSYPLTNHFKIFVDGRYTSGRKIFVDEIKGKNGTYETVFGLSYSGFWDKKPGSKEYFSPDSAKRNIILLTYKTGIIGSMNSQNSRNSYGPNGGIVAGFSFDFILNSNLAVSTGLTYEQKGYQFKDSSDIRFIYKPFTYSGSTSYNDCKIGIDYLVIPLTLKIKFGSNQQYFINGGFYSGLRLNARVTGNSIVEYRSENGYLATKYTVYDNIDGYIKDEDWGWVVVGGVLIPFHQKHSIEIGFTYSQGWKNVLNYPSSLLTLGADKTIKNRSLNLTIGFPIIIF